MEPLTIMDDPAASTAKEHLVDLPEHHACSHGDATSGAGTQGRRAAWSR